MDPKTRSDELRALRLGPDGQYLNEIGVLRRQVKNLERELRHLQAQLNSYQMRSPWANEEEEMDEFIERVTHRVEQAVESATRDDGSETNGDAGPLD